MHVRVTAQRTGLFGREVGGHRVDDLQAPVNARVDTCDALHRGIERGSLDDVERSARHDDGGSLWILGNRHRSCRGGHRRQGDRNREDQFVVAHCCLPVNPGRTLIGVRVMRISGQRGPQQDPNQPHTFDLRV